MKSLADCGFLVYKCFDLLWGNYSMGTYSMSSGAGHFIALLVASADVK